MSNSPDNPPSVGAAASTEATRQIADLPKDELEHVAVRHGLDPGDFKSRQHLVAALHERRQVIASMDRDAMLDVIRWARRPVASNATREQLAFELAQVRSMRFDGLSQRGLVILAAMRGVAAGPKDDVAQITNRLRKQEGLLARLGRKRRALVGRFISRMIGEDATSEYQFLPATSEQASGAGVRLATVQDEIEEVGVIGGLTSRIRKGADSYLNQKLDDIEARIDRKLDEIDRRLAEWRDKEIANRIRILKITLWVTVTVAACSLIYTYLQIYAFPKAAPALPSQRQSTTR